MDRVGDSTLSRLVEWFVLWARLLLGGVVVWTSPARLREELWSWDGPASPMTAGFRLAAWGLGPPGRWGSTLLPIPVRARRLHDSMDSA